MSTCPRSRPRSDVRRALVVGDRVKLLFVGSDLSTERMWVEVTDVVDGRYVGRLANEPISVTEVRSGDHVGSGPEHVAAILRETPYARGRDDSRS